MSDDGPLVPQLLAALLLGSVVGAAAAVEPLATGLGLALAAAIIGLAEWIDRA